MTVAVVAAGMSKYERIKEMTVRRVDVYRNIFQHLTGHESYEEAQNDTRMMGSEGVVGVNDDDDEEIAGEDSEDENV
jgi:hypothetical protein